MKGNRESGTGAWRSSDLHAYHFSGNAFSPTIAGIIADMKMLLLNVMQKVSNIQIQEKELGGLVSNMFKSRVLLDFFQDKFQNWVLYYKTIFAIEFSWKEVMSMGIVEELLKNILIPRMVKVRQNFEAMLPEAQDNDKIEILSEPQAIAFDLSELSQRFGLI